VVRHSDHVSTHNAALGEYLAELAGRPIPLSIDVPGVELGPPPDDAALSSLRHSLGIGTGRKVVLYRGTFYRFAGVPELVALMAPLLRRRPELLFLIVGEGEARRDVESMVRCLELSESVKIRAFVPRDELHALFRIATVSVNPFESSMVTDCALPARVLQSLRAGIPCVSTPLRGLVASVAASPMLRYEEMGPSFVDAVESFVVDPRKPSSAHVDALAPLADFTWATAIDRWEAMMSKVTRSVRRVATP
jgi:glycosyltransferase involved in cell wall biosynthesis